jgi:hypothetical protein
MINQNRQRIKATPRPDVMAASSLPNLYDFLKLYLYTGRILVA